jgi:predicted Zn-dependent protease
VEAAAPEAAAPIEAAEVAPEVASCLDLIGQAKFQEALPVCLAALKIDPDNEAVQDAVAQARTETAKMAGSGEAAASAGEAAGQAEEAAKGLTGKLGE